MMNRRQFLQTSAAAAALPLLPRVPAPLFSISLAQWSLHRSLRGGQKPAIDNLDFAATAREFGIDAIEYVNTFFKKHARDEKYLAEMKRRAAGEGVHSLLIMVDAEGNLGEPEKKARARAVENHVKWLEAAKFLGCHSIRVNARSRGSREEQMKLAADGLRALTEKAAKMNLNVLVENHGGLSSDGSWLAGVMKKVGHERCGTLPDFGNFHIGGGKSYDRYRGVAELMPYAKAVSAKSHAFDGSGNEKSTDYLKMMKIVLDAGYTGYVGIEYEGSSVSERRGIRKTKELLERVRRQLAGGPPR